MKEILALFPEPLQHLVNMHVEWKALQEIRVRVNRELEAIEANRSYSIPGAVMTPKELSYLVNQVSQFSLYRYNHELREGFITIEGGHRIGLAGKVNKQENHIETLKHICFMNIRIARQAEGYVEPFIPHLFQNGKWLSTLIIGPPHSGKTTLLRSLAKWIGSDRRNFTAAKVAIIDERSEIAACLRGIPQLQVGERTDVMDACPKAEGMMMMIRSMSPEVLIVDEIGGQKDAEAVEEAIFTGVEVICTIHGENLETLEKRPTAKRLLQEGVFSRFFVLDRLKESHAHDIQLFNEKGDLIERVRGGDKNGMVRSTHRFDRYNMGGI
ncbi:stage III sporulation protein AA [Halobacillus fulvus]|nr:stage III sporulation protein AA [Halobacillus fulvus]